MYIIITVYKILKTNPYKLLRRILCTSYVQFLYLILLFKVHTKLIANISCTLRLRNILKQLFTWNSLYCLMKSWIFLVAQIVKNLHLIQETQVWSLDWEDPLEKRMATHSSILAWRIPWTESLVGYSPRGWRVRHDWMTNTFTFTMKSAQKQSFKNYTVWIWRYQTLSLI